MRTWVVLLALLLSGCTAPGVEPPQEAAGRGPDAPPPEQVPVIDMPEGRIEVRWPGGDWSEGLSWSRTLRVNATGPVTDLPPPGHPERFEARFVGDLDPNGTWRATWMSETMPYSYQHAQGRDGFVGDVRPGRTLVRLELFDDRTGTYAAFGPLRIDVQVAWEVHGTVQPVPVQAPGAPPALHELRVPVEQPGGTLRLDTRAVGDAPATGRDLRLGYRYAREEVCGDAPPAGSVDNTEHLLELGLWGEGTVVQAFVGSPSGRCSGGLGGPTNAEPIDYVLRASLLAWSY